MHRTLNRLSARGVAAQTKPGIYADGAGLYLRVRSATTRSWVFIWHESGKRREMGLGALPHVSLLKARERAQSVRDIIADGGDPVALKRSKSKTPTFGELADEFIKDRTPTVKSDKSVARWERCIGPGGHADLLRPLRVDRVTTDQVLEVLRPLWTTKASTAGTLRGYIEGVLNVAKARGHRLGDNPAAWDGHLAMILPKLQRLTRGHHKAMPFDQLPAFMAQLRAVHSLGARALELTILCAARSSETLLADWSEIDMDKRVMTLSSERMKAGIGHRIPLSDEAIRVLEGLPTRSGPLFPSRSTGKPLSGMAMEMVLRRMNVDVTVHGFRSTFRDWAGEITDAPREVAEAALAHRVGNNAELAYRRGDALEKRRKLMQQWAGYCFGTVAAEAVGDLDVGRGS
jgi:integrase